MGALKGLLCNNFIRNKKTKKIQKKSKFCLISAPPLRFAPTFVVQTAPLVFFDRLTGQERKSDNSLTLTGLLNNSQRYFKPNLKRLTDKQNRLLSLNFCRKKKLS